MFKPTKEIKSKTGEVIFRRYKLFSTPWFCCFLHEWFESDRDIHMHTHPWNFAGMILAGGYIEETPSGLKTRGPLFIFKRKHSHVHKVKKLLAHKGWTLFFTGKENYPWGFLVDNKIISNDEYRKLKKEGKLGLN
jgi:hypothetical protein